MGVGVGVSVRNLPEDVYFPNERLNISSFKTKKVENVPRDARRCLPPPLDTSHLHPPRAPLNASHVPPQDASHVPPQDAPHVPPQDTPHVPPPPAEVPHARPPRTLYDKTTAVRREMEGDISMT